MLSGFFSRHQEVLSDNLRYRRAFGLESEFEVVDDIVYYFMIFDKSNDFRFCTAVGTEEGVYLIDFTDHPGPPFYENILLAI